MKTEEDIKSRGYFCNSTDDTVIISQRVRVDRKQGKKYGKKTEFLFKQKKVEIDS